MRYFTFVFSLFVFSCNTPAPPPDAPGDKLAKSICGCTAKLMELNQAAQSAADSLAFRRIEAEFEKTRDCVSALEIKKEDRAAIEASLVAKCPSLASNKELLLELLGQ